MHLKFNEILDSLGNFNLIKLYEFESKDNIDNRFLLNDKRLNSYSKNIGKLSNDLNKNNYEIEGFYLPIWKVVLITDKELFSQQSLFNNVFIRRKKRSINSNINVNKILSLIHI